MVSLTCGSAEFALVSLPAGEYPALPEPPQPAGTIDGGVLAVAASQVVPSASRDDTLPMLTAVCLDVAGETITLAATDRYRLAVSEMRWAPSDRGIQASLLVPARTLADVARTMAPGVTVELSFGASGAPEPSRGNAGPGDGMITFAGGGRRLSARLIAGEFIRYQSRFPSDFGCTAELPVVPFTEAVRRVSLVAERASPVQLTFRPGQVVIEAHAEGRARAVEAVPAEFSGAEPVISFNPHYLLDGLAAAALPAVPPGGGRKSAAPAEGDAVPSAGSGRIRLEFTSPTKPALITWAGERSSAADVHVTAGGAQAGTPAGRKAPADGEAPAGIEAPGDGATGGDAPAGGSPADRAAGQGGRERALFRYLVVPLRAPVRS